MTWVVQLCWSRWAFLFKYQDIVDKPNIYSTEGNVSLQKAIKLHIFFWKMCFPHGYNLSIVPEIPNKHFRVEKNNIICTNEWFIKTKIFWEPPSFPDSSVGKESTCNAGDPSLIPGSWRSTGEGIGYPPPVFLGFPCDSAGKESICNMGDMGSILWVRSLGSSLPIPGIGRSPGEGKGYPLQYSGLENSMDCVYIVHGVTKSQWLSNFHLHFQDSTAKRVKVTIFFFFFFFRLQEN